MNETHVGSDFDDFLREEGLLEEAEGAAAKRVHVYQDSEAMTPAGTGGSPQQRRPERDRIEDADIEGR